MSQTVYNLNPAYAVEGMQAEMRDGDVIISKVASGLVPVGKLCAPGTDAEVGTSPTAALASNTTPGQVVAFPAAADSSPLSGTLYVGVPLYDSSRQPFTSGNQFSDKDPVMVMRKGVVWVAVIESITQYGDVYVWVNPGGGDPVAGSFAAGSHAGKCVLLNGARYMTSITTSGLVMVELTLA